MEKDKKLIVFRPINIFNVPNHIIMAMDYIDNYIYVGTKNGTVLR